MNELTKKLLLACKKEGYRFVAIGENWNRIPSCRDWPSGHDNSIFCSPNVLRGHWPAIWRIAEEVGIKTGCGNSQQMQYYGDLTTGKYDLKNL